MTYYEYTDAESALEAIDVYVKDCVGDNPGISEHDAYHDIAQSIMDYCDPETRLEVSRRTGVPRPSWRTDDSEDDSEEDWLSLL